MTATTTEELGGHPGLPRNALSKHEVAALLCRAGVEAGFWVIPEFEVRGLTGSKRSIDVVWARRCPRDSHRPWAPVAAFEIEGHGVGRGAPHASITKNAESLTAAGALGASVRAMVLFQAGPDGSSWDKGSATDHVPTAQRLIDRALAELPPPQPAEVVLDEQLVMRLSEWQRLLAG